MENNKNKYGLSRKTNVAMASVGSLGLMAAQPFEQTWLVAMAVLIIALTCIITQGITDNRGAE